MGAPIDTRERILDAAERLYAEKGLDGVSLREINREAQQRLLIGSAVKRHAAVMSDREDHHGDVIAQ